MTDGAFGSGLYQNLSRNLERHRQPRTLILEPPQPAYTPPGEQTSDSLPAREGRFYPREGTSASQAFLRGK